MKKYYFEGPTFKLWRGSWDPIFKFGTGSRAPLLNFEEGPGFRVPRSQVLGSWSHFTPSRLKYLKVKIKLLFISQNKIIQILSKSFFPKHFYGISKYKTRTIFKRNEKKVLCFLSKQSLIELLALKVHLCRFENLRICLCSYRNNTLKISHF